MMQRIQVAAIATAIGLACSACSDIATAEKLSNTISGVASVIDGDTIEIHGERIRLSGYDTPERGKRCGSVNVYQKAAFALSDFIGRQTVHCNVTGRDRYERSIATCAVGGIDLGDHMVREGWGRDWPRYSKGRYAGEERSARSRSKGVWGLSCPDSLWGKRNYD